MTTIKASCPTCGDVELTAHQVRLVVCSVRSWSYYAFSCASCLEEVRKPAGRDVVALLISGGVLAEPWAVPAEALERTTGPRWPTTTCSTSRSGSTAPTWSRPPPRRRPAGRPAARTSASRSTAPDPPPLPAYPAASAASAPLA